MSKKEYIEKHGREAYEMLLEKNRARYKLFKETNPEKYQEYVESRRSYNHVSNRCTAEKKMCIEVRGRCERCGDTENLQAHHIIPLKYCKPTDLLCLCASCHQVIDAQIRGIEDTDEIINITKEFLR